MAGNFAHQSNYVSLSFQHTTLQPGVLNNFPFQFRTALVPSGILNISLIFPIFNEYRQVLHGTMPFLGADVGRRSEPAKYIIYSSGNLSHRLIYASDFCNDLFD